MSTVRWSPVYREPGTWYETNSENMPVSSNPQMGYPEFGNASLVGVPFSILCSPIQAEDRGGVASD